MRISIACAFALVISTAAAAPISRVVTQAVNDPSRPAEQRATDADRKPAETLTFAGVRPGMVVGEFYPGTGYFSRMLARMVGPSGHVYGLENERWMKPEDAAKLSSVPGITVDRAPFGTVRFPRPLDIAWVTQNYHDLKIAEYGSVDTAVFNRAVYAALRPGGTFFILDHEAPAGTDLAGIARLHRIERTQVIREVTAAGFRLVAEGDFLRRATDDHSLSIFDKRIQGHTDQYALKFLKPAR